MLDPILQALVTAAPSAVPEIVKFIRAESEHRPPELLSLPPESETHLARLRAEARAAKAGRPDPDAA